ncbi:hypothetical protein PM076_07095 [Halorubrum ezzemoulense]|jgi:hypothetical protein|uniref:Uncharacterized protein n=2 Tax=Halorubrum ezzemoulense TaxID=337243 RepID=A0A256KBU0_HALEZ|nr:MULTISPECIES: hypothetical protein [Halorubrum]MDB2223517.1 hypothetical protein [Halorubrum ezzemoulense]MDB2237522.1 hypothetical protein [Halorubrum ezzemoulense]MDB2240879.1 hypothetical protein [Halorubrum ezzemoulense]MDB2243242.1 hypothetical protein [Halorubrum ezzemoulense]MDB2248984.1 hypothetical protein [Halorubrum ezzemoulense]
MSESTGDGEFRRTLPLFDNRDRDAVQRLLHHAVEDLRYDHPDRKVARDLYHEIREGDAIRLRVGRGIRDETLVITPAELDADAGQILDRFVGAIPSESVEWRRVATELGEWRTERELSDDTEIAFQYLH